MKGPVTHVLTGRLQAVDRFHVTLSVTMPPFRVAFDRALSFANDVHLDRWALK